MPLTFSNIAILVAASQGFLLSILIFQKHRAVFANRFLALLLMSYTLILIHLLLQDTGYYQYVPWIFLFVGFPLLAMPLHYLYTKYLINRSTIFARKDWIHIIPFVLFEIGLITAGSFSFINFSEAAAATPSTVLPIFRMFNWIIIIQGLAYIGSSFHRINHYNRHIKDVLSAIEKVQLMWLRNISLAGIFAIGVFFIEDVLMLQGINLSNFILSSLLFAFYVYGIGYVGLLKSEILASPEVERSLNTLSDIQHEVISTAAAKYEKSGLSAEAAKQYVNQLLEVMNEKKPYTETSLTLTQLAEMLSISPHNLSEVINTQLQKNFYDFVNSYRIEQVKKDLADPAKQNLKLLSIAFDAGFNSKATFNTIFKEQTGMTPSEYRKNISKETLSN